MWRNFSLILDTMPRKVDFWNVEKWGPIVVYGLVPVLTFFFAWGFFKRWKMWQQGAPEREKRIDDIPRRVGFLLKFLFTPQRMYQDRLAGIAHGLIMYGFIVLFVLGAMMDAVNANVIHYISGWIYVVQSFVLEIGGLMVIVGILLAMVRRYIIRPKHLEQGNNAGLILAWLLVVIVTGFALEGLRLPQTDMQNHPDWAWASFLGLVCSKIFAGIGLDREAVLGSHEVMWYVHMLVCMGFIAYIGWSRLRHIFTGAANIFMQSTKPTGEIDEIRNIEEAEKWGVSKVEEYSWKQLFDLDACTRCGRCEDNCPASATDKPLSPKDVIGSLKSQMERFLGTPKPTAAVATEEAAASDDEEVRDPALIGGSVEEDAIWACTTCGACLDHCPVFIPVVDKITQMRQNLVLMESRFPQEITNVFTGMENNGNPYRIGNDKRNEYLEGEDVKILAEDSDVDILYFAGCAGSFDPRNQKVAKIFVGLMKKAGVNFGMLGPEETCCGETARRIGNEYLAQTLMRQCIETFKSYNVKKIVTTCPHCYNTFKNEYHRFGGEYEVISHVEFLAQLIEQGRLKPVNPVEGRVMYHDSCYLGRHNGVYDAPRAILAAIPGLEVAEFAEARGDSFCCGAGGGRMWMEEDLGTRINEKRVADGLESNPDMMCTACPYCMTMFEDGLKAHNAEEKVDSLDLCELLAKSL